MYEEQKPLREMCRSRGLTLIEMLRRAECSPSILHGSRKAGMRVVTLRRLLTVLAKERALSVEETTRVLALLGL